MYRDREILRERKVERERERETMRDRKVQRERWGKYIGVSRWGGVSERD